MFCPEYYEYSTESDQITRGDVLLGEDMPQIRGYFDILLRKLYSDRVLDTETIQWCLWKFGLLIGRHVNSKKLLISRASHTNIHESTFVDSIYFEMPEYEDGIVVDRGGLASIIHHFDVLVFMLYNDIEFNPRSIQFHLDEIAYEISVMMPSGYPNIERSKN